MANDTMLEVAKRYAESGLSCIPVKQDKRPVISSWTTFQKRRPSNLELEGWFKSATSMAAICGAVSGNLELIDFDLKGASFESWWHLVCEYNPDLVSKLVVESSQNGGRHVVYRCENAVAGNAKLAQRAIECKDGNEIEIEGKRFKPREVDGQFLVIIGLIETRGEGGYFLCAPSPGYILEQGDFENIPTISTADRDLLLSAARACNEYTLKVVGSDECKEQSDQGSRPGDAFNDRGDVRALLQKHNWKSCRKSGDNEYWARPGKTDGWSASLRDDGVFYVHSSNAEPFEPGKAYSKFGVYAVLEHASDFKAAARGLARTGFGKSAAPAANDAEPPPPPKQRKQKEPLLPSALLQMDTTHDPDCLLGYRWLCRGGSALFVGQTGAGKSTLGMQAAICWALGEDFFGIRPAHPLKSIVFQAENDEGDLSEQLKGVVNGLNLGHRAAELDERLLFFNESGLYSDDFAKAVEQIVRDEKPDLVWIDPLLAFLGGNVSDQETVSHFLRNLLTPISQKYRFAWMLVHHANKPARDPKQRNGYTGGDWAYLGTGSAEIPNWARAVVNLIEVSEGLFELKLPKRGKRAGLLAENMISWTSHDTVTSCYLEHSKSGICWVRSAVTAPPATASNGIAIVDSMDGDTELQFFIDHFLPNEDEPPENQLYIKKKLKTVKGEFSAQGKKLGIAIRDIEFFLQKIDNKETDQAFSMQMRDRPGRPKFYSRSLKALEQMAIADLNQQK